MFAKEIMQRTSVKVLLKMSGKSGDWVNFRNKQRKVKKQTKGL